MRFDVTISPANLNDTPALAQAVEAYGFSGLWTSETAHNPFLPLPLAAAATQRITLGTAIALAFPRSPTVTAQIAWDLAAQSDGRFVLGLGTQVKAHITRRFGMDWTPPLARMRDYLGAMRAVWANWQTRKPLRYKSDTYKLTLMTPFFSPGPITHPDIPVYLAGVNEGMCALAGEMCAGLHVHPFHTVRYLREQVLPAVERGAALAGRTRAEVTLACTVFVVTGPTAAEQAAQAQAVRQQIAFYASTPSYAGVMALHGWGDVAAHLSQLAREGRWAEMSALISDDILNTVAVVAPPDELAAAVRARYDGLLDRVGYYLPFHPQDTRFQPVWQDASRTFGA